MDVFISYSRKDRAAKDASGRDVISRIQESLHSTGISYWLDEEGIHSGETFASVISRNIAEAKIFLFVSSVNSNASRWTCGEIATASAYDKHIIPFRIDDTPYDPSITIYLAALDSIDYTANPGKALKRLASSVKQYLAEQEAEARRLEEEKVLLAERRRMEANLDEKIQLLNNQIEQYLEEKKQLTARLEEIKAQLVSVRVRTKGLDVPSRSDNQPFAENRKKRIKYLPLLALLVGLLVVIWPFKRTKSAQDSNMDPETLTTLTDSTEWTSSPDSSLDMRSFKDVPDSNVSPMEENLVVKEPAAKIPFTVGGNEKDFDKEVGEAGGSFSLAVSGNTQTYTVNLLEPVEWCVVPTGKQRKSTFNLTVLPNTGVARSVMLFVESGREKITIRLLQDESQAFAQEQQRKEADRLALLEAEARKKAEQDSIRAFQNAHKPVSVEVDGLQIWFHWEGGTEGHYISSKVVTEALRKAVLGQRKRIKESDYAMPADFSKEYLGSFVSELSRKTGKRYQAISDRNNSNQIRLVINL